MRILLIGDVIGRPGRKAVESLLPGLRREYGVHFVVANGENAAGGKGLTPATAESLLESGVDVITSGNHIWAQKDIIPFLDGQLPVVRPLNYPPGVPGQGYLIKGKVMVINLQGRAFMRDIECPFRTLDTLLEQMRHRTPIIVVDFHAEATSEKNALGRYFDGRVSAVVGTHTHVATADARVFPRGTAFVTDIGMVGPMDSIIGDDIETVVQRFLTQMPSRLVVGKGDCILNSVLVEVNEATGLASSIVRVDREMEQDL
ncbi:MAG: TIGR00282 family metallophosphoesterase [Chloroflexota bacterium]|nr:TIGR00282 family metallophosphoesterase [Chloroflexota bacterium]